jgi:hypothetical protein
MDAKNWIAIGAASALGLGVMAAGAVTTANALPLVANATNANVPGITVGESADDTKGNALVFSVSSDSILSPDPTSSPSPSPTSSIDSSPSPVSPVSAASPITPPSPASVASPASVDSPASVGSSD